MLYRLTSRYYTSRDLGGWRERGGDGCLRCWKDEARLRATTTGISRAGRLARYERAETLSVNDDKRASSSYFEIASIVGGYDEDEPISPAVAAAA